MLSEKNYNLKLKRYKELTSTSNILKFQFNYIDNVGKIFLIASILGIFIMYYCLFKDYIVMTILIGIIAIFLINKTVKRIEKNYSMENGKELDIYYDPVVRDFFDVKENEDNKKQIEEIEGLLVFLELEIQEKTNSFIYNPIVLLIISFIGAFIVNYISSKPEYNFHVFIFMLISAWILSMYFLSHKAFGTSKVIQFKKFLIKYKYLLEITK